MIVRAESQTAPHQWQRQAVLTDDYTVVDANFVHGTGGHQDERRHEVGDRELHQKVYLQNKATVN